VDPAKRHRKSRRSWLIVVPGLVLAAAGGLWWTSQEPDPVGTPPASSTGEAGAEIVAGNSLPEAAPAPRQPGLPTEIMIPALDVDVPVDAILAPGGVLTPPSDPQTDRLVGRRGPPG